jgi:hypothetical protein
MTRSVVRVHIAPPNFESYGKKPDREKRPGEVLRPTDQGDQTELQFEKTTVLLPVTEEERDEIRRIATKGFPKTIGNNREYNSWPQW